MICPQKVRPKKDLFGGSNMPKQHSLATKRQVVKAHREGQGGYRALARIYSVPKTCVERWVKLYNALGEEGLQNRTARQSASSLEKLSAVQYYYESNSSYLDAAIALGLHNEAVLIRWVKAYEQGGIKTLCPKTKETADMKRVPKKPASKSEEHLKELEHENLLLRIENIYLKELRRLRLSKERQRTEQGLSTVSEDPFS